MEAEKCKQKFKFYNILEINNLYEQKHAGVDTEIWLENMSLIKNLMYVEIRLYAILVSEPTFIDRQFFQGWIILHLRL